MQKLTAKQRRIMTMMKDGKFTPIGYLNKKGDLCFKDWQNLGACLYITLSCRSLLKRGFIKQCENAATFNPGDGKSYKAYELTTIGKRLVS